MKNDRVVVSKTEKAGIVVNVESESPETKSNFFVVYSSKGKKQRERADSLESAQKRAEAVLQELLDETFPVELGVGGVTGKVYYTPTTNGYDAFTLAYYQDRKRVREQFGSLDDARRRGNKVLEDLSEGKIQSATMTLEEQQDYFSAKKYLEGTGVGVALACRSYAEILKKRNSQNVPVKTVQQTVDDFMAAKREGRATRVRSSGRVVSERYLDDLERKLTAFARRFHCLIGAVTGKDINDFIHGLDVEGRTKNNYRQAINVLFEYARKQKYLPRDHAVMDEVEAAAEADFEIEIFTPDELRKLLTHAHADLLPVLAIGAFAGLRSAEIERLEWSEINLKDGFIEVKAKKAKTRARRLAPVPDNLAAWLKKCGKREGRVWPHSSPYLFELQAKAAEDAKVPWKHNALRHSFISYRVAAIKNVDQVALEAGNSPEMILQHYRELVTADAAGKWFGIKPAKRKGKERKAKAEPENVIVMPVAAVA
ncbi:MAG TPA: site-specific integrase [Verrucomicrobiae bacterium]|nr:site-specific integrase [Verrucomicrobiae bacterium]